MFNLKIREYADLSLYISGAVTTFMFIGLMTSQAHAQTLSPLTEDQDGDGDPLNEENEIKADCEFDFTSGVGAAVEATTGKKMETILSEDDCNFVMHYLSGQCEEQTAKGANVTQVCDYGLRDYLSAQNLYTKDYPTDTARFNELLEEGEQKRILKEQQRIREEQEAETNRPDWAENLPMG